MLDRNSIFLRALKKGKIDYLKEILGTFRINIPWQLMLDRNSIFLRALKQEKLELEEDFMKTLWTIGLEESLWTIERLEESL